MFVGYDKVYGGCAQTPYPVRDLVRLFAGCGVNALSGLRFGASVGRISAAHPALIHAGLNGRGLCAKPCCQ
ncbi:hypothetical protein O5172_25500, partial [Escherichia coli]|nr:hypothetical protein [Escherichia coli]